MKAEKGNKVPQQILLVVSGGAGSGKSTLIESLETWMTYILSGHEVGESGHSTDQPILVKCAFTGAAADNIGGNTLTRTFGLSYDGKHTSLGDRERDAKRELFSKVRIASFLFECVFILRSNLSSLMNFQCCLRRCSTK